MIPVYVDVTVLGYRSIPTFPVTPLPRVVPVRCYSTHIHLFLFDLPFALLIDLRSCDLPIPVTRCCYVVPFRSTPGPFPVACRLFEWRLRVTFTILRLFVTRSHTVGPIYTISTFVPTFVPGPTFRLRCTFVDSHCCLFPGDVAIWMLRWSTIYYRSTICVVPIGIDFRYVPTRYTTVCLITRYVPRSRSSPPPHTYAFTGDHTHYRTLHLPHTTLHRSRSRR